MADDPRETLIRAIREDGRYPPEAYEFLHQGLDFTARRLFGESATSRPRHVSGQQLCEGLRDLALQRWGFMARVVLSEWNIRATRDFGEMVFFLIDRGLMGRQESDTLEDFTDVYSFRQAFDGYDIRLDEPGE